MLLFRWIESFDDPFLPNMLQNDLDILELSLSHEEGHPAKLILRLPSSGTVLKKYALLSHHPSGQAGTLLFRGLLESVEHLGAILKISLRAQAPNAPINDLIPSLTRPPFFNSFFFSQTSQERDVDDLLKGHPAVVYWARTTGQCTLSHLTQGNTQETIPSNPSLFLTESLPVSTLHLRLQCQWVQHLEGIINLFPLLQKSFSQHRLATYTPDSLLRAWPQQGMLLGRSGYKVIESTLYEVDGEASFFPIEVPGKSTDMAFKKTFFEGKLKIGWSFRQKRKECLECTLTTGVPGRTKEITLSLGKLISFEDIPFWEAYRSYKTGEIVRYLNVLFEAKENHKNTAFSPDQWTPCPEKTKDLSPSFQSSFFITSQGYDAFRYALQRANVLFLKESRVQKVVLKGTLEEFGHLTLDHTLCLDHPQLGELKGKVTFYEVYAKENLRQVTVHIACTPNELSQHLSEPLPSSCLGQEEYVSNYVEESYQRRHNAQEEAAGFVYYRYDDQLPQDPHASLQSIRPKDMLDSVAIEHDADQQERVLESHKRQGTIPSLKTAITRICAQFRKLQGVDERTHTIKVRTLPRPPSS